MSFVDKRNGKNSHLRFRVLSRNNDSPNPTPLLDCEGKCGPHWIKHEFVKRKKIMEGYPKKTAAWELLYKCTSCGHVRRFGLEESAGN